MPGLEAFASDDSNPDLLNSTAATNFRNIEMPGMIFTDAENVSGDFLWLKTVRFKNGLLKVVKRQDPEPLFLQNRNRGWITIRFSLDLTEFERQVLQDFGLAFWELEGEKGYLAVAADGKLL
ncbi:MAG: hypothetical protein R2879_04035 [Saprospiraceae bacterium]